MKNIIKTILRPIASIVMRLVTRMERCRHCNQCSHFKWMGKDNEGEWGICDIINRPLDIKTKACWKCEKVISSSTVLIMSPLLIVLPVMYNIYKLGSFILGKQRNCKNCSNFRQGHCTWYGEIIDTHRPCTIWISVFLSSNETERIIGKSW